MANKKWQDLVSKPMYRMKSVKDVYVGMRDGTRLCIDMYLPDDGGKFPALLSYSPYGKDVQKLPIVPGPVDFRLGNGGIEAGESEYFVPRGYVHVIADIRGTGKSEGGYRFFSKKEQKDGYELIEWIAAQPWCDGNVGMLGMSYFSMIQPSIAALNPPHLRAIFLNDAMTDIYRQWFYHGGMLNYGFLFQWWIHVPVHTIDPLDLSGQELKELVESAKKDENNKACPIAYVTLDIPEKNIPLFDALIHPTDGPYYWERSSYNKFTKITVPSFMLSRWTGQSGHLPGAFNAYSGINTPKRLRIGPTEVKQGGFGRPWHENHDIILRWYDHWLKGIDTGIMDDPPIQIYVQNTGKWRFENEWPLERTEWKKFYLREDAVLSEEFPSAFENPDHFTSIPRLKRGQKVPSVKYLTRPLVKETEITGPMALYLHGALSTPDANWVVELGDVAPDGSVTMVTIGWLRASHRQIDEERSKPYKPFHSHLKKNLVTPGVIYEYAIEIIETSYLFQTGHRIQLLVKGQDAYWEGPESFRELIFHLTNRSETEYTIYHTTEYPSYILTPVIP